ncbi:MAG: CvpA family protein [Patescibacteria group bacterium]|nr:CvpA family protein [Patescibacteria group bacterium]
MSYFDIALIIIVVGFVLNGLSKGLIRLLGKLAGLIVGIFIASHFYLQFYQWGQGIFGGRESLGKVVSFIVVFILVTLVIDWVFIFIEKIFKLISIIPFTGLINRLLGGALGFLEGSLFIGMILFVASKYAWIGSFFGDHLVSSQVTPFFLSIVQIVAPILPTALKALQSVI